MEAVWQPIETAPKVEGEYLLGFDAISAEEYGSRDAGVCVITWMAADEDAVADGYEDEWQVQPFSDGLDCVASETNVTHWMPLPSAPVAA